MIWTFGEWIVAFSSNLASKTRWLVPPWQLAQDYFFQHWKEEEMVKGSYGPPAQIVWKILWNLKHAVPNHLADNCQMH